MSDFLIKLIFIIIGSVFGSLVRRKDPLATFFGIAIGVALGFSVAEHTGWYLLAIPPFAFFLLLRRRQAQSD